MPSPMIHLTAAYKFSPEASGSFYMGCIMPDYTNDRTKKDKIHFRDISDKWGALAELAITLDPQDAFLEGWLFHLFTDCRWDESILKAYIAKNGPDGWFLPYREQTKLASYWLFNNSDWACSIWEKVISAPLKQADIESAPTDAEMDWYRTRVYERHKENTGLPSSAFPPPLLEDFTRETAEYYTCWRKAHCY